MEHAIRVRVTLEAYSRTSLDDRAEKISAVPVQRLQIRVYAFRAFAAARYIRMNNHEHS